MCRDRHNADNGSAFVSKQLLRACAKLKIRLIHSRPGEPAGRGKIERFFRTVRDHFLVELQMRAATNQHELNVLFGAWVESIYHHRIHSETGQKPLDRFDTADPPRLPTPAELREAFLWSERRVVTKTRTFSLHGNRYEVDTALPGTTVELVYDPFDLTVIDVRHNNQSIGQAVPLNITRRVHPQARTHDPEPVPRTGIDYLALIRDQHLETTRKRISYATSNDTSQPSQPADPTDTSQGEST